MLIKNSTVLVTGASRGLGAAYVTALQERGAAKIYAGVRNTHSVPHVDGVEAIQLDVTDPAQVAAAVQKAGDVQILINNAGIAAAGDVLEADLDAIRREMEVNFYGTLLMSRAFAPILGANGGGVIVNALSAAALFTTTAGSTYSATKAAAWSLTDTLRNELAGQGTHVTGLFMGLVDTDMVKDYDVPKPSPAAMAEVVLDGIEAGLSEILADEWSAFIKSGLSLEPTQRYRDIAAALSGS